MSRSLLALALSLASNMAFAAPTRTAVVELLSGFEGGPSVDALRSLGEGTDAELRAIGSDPTLAETTRMAAVYALYLFPTDDNLRYLQSTLRGADKRLARKATWALAGGWADTAIPDLQFALSDSDTQVRIAAAEALGQVGSENARSALRARLPAESNATVVATINQALSR